MKNETVKNLKIIKLVFLTHIIASVTLFKPLENIKNR